VYTLPRGVRVGCLWVLIEWFEWMWSVTPSLACSEARPKDTPGQAVYSHNRDGYGVQWCGREGGGSEIW